MHKNQGKNTDLGHSGILEWSFWFYTCLKSGHPEYSLTYTNCVLQETKSEMERQRREHQESSAQAAEKHCRQLKDLGKDPWVWLLGSTKSRSSPPSVCFSLLHSNTLRDVLQPEAGGGAREIHGAAAEIWVHAGGLQEAAQGVRGE